MSDDLQRMTDEDGDEWTVGYNGYFFELECVDLGGVSIPPDVLPWLRDQIDRHLEGGE